MQVHPGGHAHEGVVDRERVLSIAQRPCSPSPCRVAVRDGWPGLLPGGAVHMPTTRGAESQKRRPASAAAPSGGSTTRFGAVHMPVTQGMVDSLIRRSGTL